MYRSHMFQMKHSSGRYRRVFPGLLVRVKLDDSPTEQLVKCKCIPKVNVSTPDEASFTEMNLSRMSDGPIGPR